MANRRTRIGLWALQIGGIGAIAALGGIGLIQAGAIPPMGGFALFALGTVVAGLSATLLGLLGWVAARRDFESGRRRQALAGIVVGAALLGAVFYAGRDGQGLPRINDIATDVTNPPAFHPDTVRTDPAGRDMTYPDGFAEQVRGAYPDLAPLDLAVAPSEAFALALGTARAQGWQITHQSEPLGSFDATDTTRIFRFVDDITVRVLPQGEGSRIDVRSKSRDGRGDLGANANRIRVYTAELREQAGNS
ncbi:MAG: DUF1499 domain-containing protein [Deltaproteobacteria bacterium]|nr:DUF1499 domain-containing protein [Deltaproteobacteria bacterium]